VSEREGVCVCARARVSVSAVCAWVGECVCAVCVWVGGCVGGWMGGFVCLHVCVFLWLRV